MNGRTVTICVGLAVAISGIIGVFCVSGKWLAIASLIVAALGVFVVWAADEEKPAG